MFLKLNPRRKSDTNFVILNSASIIALLTLHHIVKISWLSWTYFYCFLFQIPEDSEYSPNKQAFLGVSINRTFFKIQISSSNSNLEFSDAIAF